MTESFNNENIHMVPIEKTAMTFKSSGKNKKKAIDKVQRTVRHVFDYFQYRFSKLNVGPFGYSQYTEDPWKPLFINCCSQPNYATKEIKSINTLVPTIGNLACHNEIPGISSIMKDETKQKTKCSILSFYLINIM